MIYPEISIVPIPKKMEIGSPGNTLFRFNPDIVIPVPNIIAIEHKIMTIMLFERIRELEVKML